MCYWGIIVTYGFFLFPVMEAMLAESPTVANLLTDYILKGENQNSCSILWWFYPRGGTQVISDGEVQMRPNLYT